MKGNTSSISFKVDDSNGKRIELNFDSELHG